MKLQYLMQWMFTLDMILSCANLKNSVAKYLLKKSNKDLKETYVDVVMIFLRLL